MINKLYLAFLLTSIVFMVNAQDSNLSAKFNTGTSFSTPGGDLGEVAPKGKPCNSFQAPKLDTI